MSEALKHNNEIAIRRKRIFQLFKRFHPDVLSGSGYENEAAELAKVLTAILDLEIGEAIPKEFRGKTLAVVFIDEDGRSLRSKTPLAIADTQEEFLFDLEYIISNKKMPAKERVYSQNTEQRSEPSRDKSSGQSTSRENQGEKSTNDSTFESRIKQIQNPTEAKTLKDYFSRVKDLGVLKYSDFSHLEDVIQVRVNQLMKEKFRTTTINNPTEAKTLKDYFSRVKDLGVLKYSDFSHLEDVIQVRVKTIW